MESIMPLIAADLIEIGLKVIVPLLFLVFWVLHQVMGDREHVEGKQQRADQLGAGSQH